MAEYWWQHNQTFGTQDLLASVGSIIAAYNLCEVSLWGLLDEVLSPPRGLGNKLFPILKGNQDRLKALAAAIDRVGDDGLTAKVTSYVKHFSICSENRNLIAHSIYQQDFSAFPDTAHLLAKGTSRSGFAEMNQFPADTAEMLKIANQCYETYLFGMRLMSYIVTKPGHQLQGMPPMLSALPETPPQPDRLMPIPPKE